MDPNFVAIESGTCDRCNSTYNEKYHTDRKPDDKYIQVFQIHNSNVRYIICNTCSLTSDLKSHIPDSLTIIPNATELVFCVTNGISRYLFFGFDELNSWVTKHRYIDYAPLSLNHHQVYILDRNVSSFSLSIRDMDYTIRGGCHEPELNKKTYGVTTLLNQYLKVSNWEPTDPVKFWKEYKDTHIKRIQIRTDELQSMSINLSYQMKTITNEIQKLSAEFKNLNALGN